MQIRKPKVWMVSSFLKTIGDLRSPYTPCFNPDVVLLSKFIDKWGISSIFVTRVANEPLLKGTYLSYCHLNYLGLIPLHGVDYSRISSTYGSLKPYILIHVSGRLVEAESSFSSTLCTLPLASTTILGRSTRV